MPLQQHVLEAPASQPDVTSVNQPDVTSVNRNVGTPFKDLIAYCDRR